MLANFVAEFTPSLGTSVGICLVTIKQWQVYMDGASNARGSRVRIVMVSPEELRLEKSSRLGFRTSNNEAKYKALIAGLRAVQRLGIPGLKISSESNRRELCDKGLPHVTLFKVVWISTGQLPKS